MTPASHFRAGDSVRIRLASRIVRGEVLEDRGPLGPSGEHVLRVAWKPTGSFERVELEVRESQLVKEGKDFEHQVEQIVKQFGELRLERPSATKGGGWVPDFVLQAPSRNAVVEAKSLPGGGAPKEVSRIEAQLLRARDQFDADTALLVVPAWSRVLMRRPRREGLSVVPLASLHDWLSDYVRP